MEQLTTTDLFFCYDERLSKFLSQNGLAYLLKARTIKHGSIFTVYQKGDELQMLLDKFRQQKLA